MSKLPMARLVIVEDEPDILDLMKDILNSDSQPQPRQFNYEFLEARDGKRALQLIREHAPDLVLLDVKIPKLDGYEVCRQLKDDGKTKHIPVLMITAKGQKKEMEDGLRSGANDYIVKPFEVAVLRDKVQHFLTQARAS